MLLNRGRPPLVDARVQDVIEVEVASQCASENCVTEGSSDHGVNMDDTTLKEVNKDRLRKNLRLVPVSRSTISRCKAVAGAKFSQHGAKKSTKNREVSVNSHRSLLPDAALAHKLRHIKGFLKVNVDGTQVTHCSGAVL